MNGPPTQGPPMINGFALIGMYTGLAPIALEALKPAMDVCPCGRCLGKKIRLDVRWHVLPNGQLEEVPHRQVVAPATETKP